MRASQSVKVEMNHHILQKKRSRSDWNEIPSIKEQSENRVPYSPEAEVIQMRGYQTDKEQCRNGFPYSPKVEKVIGKRGSPR
ncbi:hypothetical protein J6590_033911 [Homalodisca vitripennis]|nr:hypothetical protein J6590_033911 [Homalodisca vitripennis]